MTARTVRPLEMPPFGDLNAPKDSVGYAVYIRDMAAARLNSVDADRLGVDTYVTILQQKHLFSKLQREDGRYFTTWTDFCLTPQPYGLGRSPQDIAQIVAEQKDPKTIAEKASPQPTLSEAMAGNQNAKKDNRNRQSTAVCGTRRDASYFTARIARDHPQILAQMKAGKYPSVRAAAKAAGILKEATPLSILKRAWGKASPAERAAFHQWMEES